MKKIIVTTIIASLLPFSGPVKAISDYNKINFKSSICAVEYYDLKNLQNLSQKITYSANEKNEIIKIANKIKKAANICREKISKAKDIDSVYPLINEKENDSCFINGSLQESASHYLNILRFTPEEMKGKGYKNEEEIKSLLNETVSEIKKINYYCKNKQTLPEPAFPSNAENTSPLLNYFRSQTLKTTKTTNDSLMFMKNFKRINEKNSSLTKEFIINHNDFSLEEILSLISELSFEKTGVYFQNEKFISEEEKFFNASWPELPFTIRRQGESTEIILAKIKINSQSNLRIGEQTITMGDVNIATALREFLRQNPENQGIFNLSIDEEGTPVLQGVLKIKARLFGLFPINIQQKQNYFFSGNSFILQNQQSPWWRFFSL